MLEAYKTSTTTYAENDVIALENIRYEDCRIRVSNSSTFTIVAPGRYYVYCGATALSATDGTPITIQLYENGEPVSAVVSSTSTTNPQQLTFSTIISVLPSSCYADNRKRLQVRVASGNGDISAANLVIFKLR